jgi:hypothetical protein
MVIFVAPAFPAPPPPPPPPAFFAGDFLEGEDEPVTSDLTLGAVVRFLGVDLDLEGEAGIFF